MGKGGVEVEGVPQLRRNFDRCAAEMAADTDDALGRPADAIRAATAAAQPVLSGRLRQSVQVERIRGGRTVELGAGLPYAPWIEYGGSRGRPHVAGGRTLQPALAQNADLAVSEVGRTVDTITRKFSA